MIHSRVSGGTMRRAVGPSSRRPSNHRTTSVGAPNGPVGTAVLPTRHNVLLGPPRRRWIVAVAMKYRYGCSEMAGRPAFGVAFGGCLPGGVVRSAEHGSLCSDHRTPRQQPAQGGETAYLPRGPAPSPSSEAVVGSFLAQLVLMMRDQLVGDVGMDCHCLTSEHTIRSTGSAGPVPTARAAPTRAAKPASSARP
jgi:hypothetical protein